MMCERERILTEIKKNMPQNPILKGWRSYSQCDEDGIIRECLMRIKKGGHESSNTFIEFGCGNGIENNTAQLILDGFVGCWLDGSHENILCVENNLGGLIFPALWVREAFLDLNNVEKITKDFAAFLGTQEIDFCSLDIDGNDSHLLAGILSQVTPKLLCVEYNAKFPPPTALEIEYDSSRVWQQDDYFGASLQAFVNILEGYKLVCCNISGSNAFFVDNKFANLFEKYDINDLYQPARYWLCGAGAGHAPSFKWAKQVLRQRKVDTPWLIDVYAFPPLSEEILFGKYGNDSVYLQKGFSIPEDDFRWTVGNVAVIAFDSREKASEGFCLLCNIFPFCGEGLSKQRIKILINGIEHAFWEISVPEEKCLSIPSSLAQNGRLQVEFHLLDATSPKELGLSDDSRKLALAFKKITLNTN